METVERMQKLMSGAPEEIWKRVLQVVMVLENDISEVENELREASEEMRRLTVERRQAEAEGLRVSEAVSGAQSSEGEAGLVGSREQRYPSELGEEC